MFRPKFKFTHDEVRIIVTVVASALYDRMLKDKCTAASEKILKRV